MHPRPRFQASDPDNGDESYAEGDVFTLTFDKPTDTPAVETRLAIDTLLSFSQAKRRRHGTEGDMTTRERFEER